MKLKTTNIILIKKYSKIILYIIYNMKGFKKIVLLKIKHYTK